MRRIFYLITELDVGGAEKTVYELATRLDRRRFEPIVGCLSGRGEVGAWLADAGVEVVYINMTSWWNAAAWLRLRRALREQRPHVLHTFLFHANFAGRLAAVGTGIRKVIASVRVEEPRLSHLWGERLTRGLTDVVTCVSESARRYTHERARVPLDKLVAIPNAIDPERYLIPPAPTPAEWELPDEAPAVAVIGRLTDQKDPLTMLQVAERVVRQVPDAIFLFAGDGPLAEECRAKAAKLGIGRSTRWLGWMRDIRPLLGRMDALALSSQWEGMPNVVLEAMACRKPVVATAVGGTSELVVDGETGILAQLGDVEQLAAGITALLRDRRMRERLGLSGYERAVSEFSYERLVRANERLYEL